MPKIDIDLRAIIPPLQTGELALLEASIQAEGCRDALVIWNGTDTIVDGHNRFDICTKHNIPFRTTAIDFQDRYAVIDWICKNQLGRRNLTDMQRADLIGKRYNNEKQQGQRTDLTSGNNCPKLTTADKIAKQEHVAPRTVKNHATFSEALDILEGIGIPRSELTSTKRKVRKTHILQLAQMAERDPDAALAAWTKVIAQGEHSGAIKSGIREVQNEQALTELPPNKTDLVSIVLGDFREQTIGLPDASVDAIITDPPYPQEYLPLWADLSRTAMRVLKPGGWCIAFSGKQHLYEVMSMMVAGGLIYYWQIIFMQTVQAAIQARSVNTCYKPILVFQKPPLTKPDTYIQDVIHGKQVEKDIHEWQQSENGFEWLIERFTNVNHLIVDPFCGSGTMPVLAQRLKRRCIAYEIEEGTHASACKRLAKEQDAAI